MGELGFCHYSDVFQAVTGGLISDITADSGVPIFLVRSLHNKLLYMVIYSLKCYLIYFDFSQVLKFISPFLLPFIIYALLGEKGRKRVILLFLVFPIIFIFLLKNLQIGTKIYVFQGFYITIGIIGCLKIVINARRRLLNYPRN
ncbi:hypothetical protein A3D78_06555 [Candidatus Gottesmanbacteria bacterium RIFCSPHIGHO2_02_FULL_39_14]|uniref:Uncharacterized protein n=2 Tax=Candidatus Gottesmaniibacteriota TaxID=1752720 RepID=A0A1F5ZWU3_9BACT|nr:MAG: hypothetical protein A2153_00990 [Candidatus Gottesmanbacteria bacterium RBG_16_38_7b]OGG16911.1 MAG: hypothetical protein A3D78_06555 [Candidatus Gottesmanbacteria bacterium RIFCSPHIGHO2_02_FULL_39_14]